MISQKSDTAPCEPVSALDTAIREWIVPALARRFLQLRSKQSKPLFEKDGNSETPNGIAVPKNSTTAP